MDSIHVSVLGAWRQVSEHISDEIARQSVLESVQRSSWAGHPDCLAAIVNYCLTSEDCDQIEWMLRYTRVTKSLNRSNKAGLVLKYPSLLPFLARSLDQLPVIAELLKTDAHVDLLWVLSNLSPESLTNSFTDIIVILTRMLNKTGDKTTTLLAFQLILRKVDLPVLRWQSPLILDLLRREAQMRDVKYENVAVETYVQALARLLPRQRPRGDELTVAINLVQREVDYLALGGTYPSVNTTRSVTFLSALGKLVALAGTESVVHLKTLLPPLFVFMENEGDGVTLAAITVIEMVMRVCWPQIPSHCGKLFEGICRALIKHEINNGREDIRYRFLHALSLLRQLAPDQFDLMASSCIHVETLGSLLNQLPRSDVAAGKSDSLIAWDNLYVYHGLFP